MGTHDQASDLTGAPAVCEAEPRLVWDAAFGFLGMDDRYVYRAVVDDEHAGFTSTSVRRVPRSGGAEVELASAQEPEFFSANGGVLTWLDVADEDFRGEAIWMDRDGAWTRSGGDGFGLAADDAFVYLETFGVQIDRYPLGGGAPMTIAAWPASWDETHGLTAADGWVVYSTDGGLFSVAREGGAPARLADVGPVAFALLDGWVYFGASDGVDRVPVAGGPVEQFAAGASPRSIFAQDHVLVFDTGSELVIADAGGPLKRIPTTGTGVRVEGSCVYFKNDAGVWRVGY